MILRNIARTKLRTAVTITGVALAASVLMLTFFAHDSLDELMDNQFRLVQRQDIRVTFHDERSRAALYELRRLDGVRTVEGNLGVGVRLRNGWRSRRTGINGLQRDHSLHGLLDRKSRPVSLPEEGLLLSSKLAQLLDVEPGDEVAVEVLTGEKQKFTAPVAQVVEEYLGAFAYADIGWLSGRLGEELALTGASLHVDDANAAELGRELKSVPAVSAVDVKARTLRSFEETIAESQSIGLAVLALFAGIITFGVIYNTARISFSERQRELGSMRVLGFTNREVGTVLVGENLLLTAVAVVPGIALGLGFGWLLSVAYDTDLYRFPFVVQPVSMLKTVGIVAVFAILANLMVFRHLLRLDLVEVLKARE
jgi:putative ABC transport system permease protein